MAWHKTTRGCELVWIGVKITLDVKFLAVRVTLPERTVTDMRKEAAAIKGQAVVSVGRLRTFTGRLCWVSGVLPRVRWIVRVLYAVLTAHERESLQRESTQRRKGRRTTPEHFVHTKRMRLALTWICAFWESGARTITRTYMVYPPPCDVAVITDASPWGLGAVLVRVNRNHAGQILGGIVLEALESALTHVDEEALGIKIGEPNGQSVVEMLAVYVALKRWMKYFGARRRVPLIKSDSSAALGVARKYASPTPVLNHLGAEISLLLETEDAVDPISDHLPGKMNGLADFYSRLHAPSPEPEPAGLRGVKVRSLVVGTEGRGFVLPTAAQHPELWAAREPGEAE
jgi:hypothetical protein